MKLEEARRRAPGWSRPKILLGYLLQATTIYWFYRIVYRLRVYGIENVPREGPVIFASNHQSHFDPPLVGSVVRDRPCGYLAQSGLFAFKPFGKMIAFFGAIPLERGAGAAGALRSAIKELRAGRCVVVFPEGRRSPDGAMHDFQGGVLLLARKAKAAVVPVAIEGAFDAWPRSRKLPRLSGRLAIRIAPVRPAASLREGDPAETLEGLKREIETMRLALRAELRAASDGRRPKPGPGDLAYWEREERPTPITDRPASR